MKTRVAIVLLGMGAACGSGSSAVPVTVHFPLSKSVPTGMSVVQLTVSASDIETITSTQTSPFSNDISFTLNVPTGNERTFSAVAAVSGDATVGYEGTAQADIVATSDNSIPITMRYMNTSANSTAAVDGGPQVSSVSTTYSGGLFTMSINFAAAVTLDQTAGVIEFIPNAGGTARSQSIINQLKGNVAVTMPSAGTNYIMFNGTATSVDVTLYNSSDASVAIPGGDTFSASQTSPTQFQIVMSTAAFQSLIDANVDGEMNVLVGSKANATVFLTPTDPSVFTASSAAVGAAGGNYMLYDAAFNTSSL